MNSLLHKTVSLALALFLVVVTAAMGRAEGPGVHGPEDTGVAHVRRNEMQPAGAVPGARRLSPAEIILFAGNGGACCVCHSSVAEAAPVPFEGRPLPVHRAEAVMHWPALADSRFQPPRS